MYSVCSVFVFSVVQSLLCCSNMGEFKMWSQGQSLWNLVLGTGRNSAQVPSLLHNAESTQRLWQSALQIAACLRCEVTCLRLISRVPVTRTVKECWNSTHSLKHYRRESTEAAHGLLFLLKKICHFDQVEITPHHGQLTCGLLRSASVRIHSSFMTLNGLLSSSDPRPTVNSGNGTVADCMPPTQGLASWQQALILGSGGNQNETLVFYFSPIFFFYFFGRWKFSFAAFQDARGRPVEEVWLPQQSFSSLEEQRIVRAKPFAFASLPSPLGGHLDTWTLCHHLGTTTKVWGHPRQVYPKHWGCSSTEQALQSPCVNSLCI